MLTSVLLCLLASTKAVLCAWPFGPDFAYWIWQSGKDYRVPYGLWKLSGYKADYKAAVVVDQWLYIDGGEYYVLADGYPSVIYNTDTFSIDLSQSWTIETISARNINKPQAMTAARRPPLWYNPQSNLVMERGGWAYVADASLFLWSFTPDGEGGAAWSLDQSSAAAQQLSPTFGSAFTASATNFYGLSGAVPGVLNTSSDPLNPYGFAASEGLVTYDFASSGWENTSSLGGSQAGYFVQSQALFMPNFGKAGLLAILGGDSPLNQSYEYEEGASLVDMSNITIYDVDSDTWYYQIATGSVPPPRSEFCVAGLAPTDNSSYEIYVFGGSTNPTADYANPEDPGYLDVYVLSMPSFTWFQIDAPTISRRANHFCQVIGQGQMLVIGGRDPSHNSSEDGSFWPNDADPWTHGLGIFDMSTLKWTNTYNANAPNYEQPSMVKQYYANHVNATNWNNPALAALFTPRSYPTTTPNTTSSPSPSLSPAPHSNTGAVVGGVVGGIVFLAFIASLVACLLVRHHRRSVGGAEPVHEMPHEMPHEQKYEMESPPVEMPAEDDRTSKPRHAPAYAYELEVQDASKDHNFRQKRVSYA